LRAAGLDLSGSEKKPSGWCLIGEDKNLNVKTLYTDADIVEEILQTKPQVLAIDAPLTLPVEKGFRLVDKALMKEKGKPLPPLMPGMRNLTSRAIRLSENIQKLNIGVKIVETHPQTVAQKLRINRSFEDILRIIEKYHLNLISRKLSEHEVDAVLAALVAWLYLIGEVKEIRESDGVIVLPK